MLCKINVFLLWLCPNPHWNLVRHFNITVTVERFEVFPTKLCASAVILFGVEVQIDTEFHQLPNTSKAEETDVGRSPGVWHGITTANQSLKDPFLITPEEPRQP